MADIEWPWQYNFPPFFTLQPHGETKHKQVVAWKKLILDYYKSTHQSVLDSNEAQRSPLFHNSSINRTLSLDVIMVILEDMAKNGLAAPLDKNKTRWEIYWHSLEEWGDMLYTWACNNGMNNTVCTIHELAEGDNTTDEEFHGLDTSVIVKALKTLEINNKCELIEFDDNQGVKFF